MAAASRMPSVALRRTAVLGAWALLALASQHCATAPPAPDPAAGPGRTAVEVASFGDDGPLPGGSARLSLLRWSAPADAAPRTAVLCLHGSPGSARNFEALGPRLAAAGRDVWALDLPGFGRSLDPAGGRSIRAHARATLAALDALGLERVHLVAWSMGGGVALHLAELAPARVASLGLVASVGVQETEGTGARAAEQLKYAALRGAVEALDVATPHFGRWSRAFDAGRAFARNFQESDQRPLRAILERLAQPLLLVHGAGDVLASARTAQVSHDLVQHSRLVLLDGNHFLPFTHTGELERELAVFHGRHDQAGALEPRSQRLDVAPPTGAAALDPWPFELGQRAPAALQASLWIAGGVLAPLRACALAGLALGSLQFDAGWTVLALAAGVSASALRRRRLRPLLLAPAILVSAWLVPLAAAALLGIGAGRLSALFLLLLLAAWVGLGRYRVRARAAEEVLCRRDRDSRADAPTP